MTKHKQKTLENLIKEAKFSRVDSTINSKNFPPQNIEKVRKTFQFSVSKTSEEIISEMEKDGFQPANIYELLEWAKDKWNGKDFVVALGSVWQSWSGLRCVACLHGDSGGRHLGLFLWGDRWYSDCRFAAVRKS